MSRGTLPQQADLRKLANTATRLEGEIELAALPRVREVLVDSSGVLVYSLSFGFDEAGHVIINGQINASVALLCQRCLQAMSCPIQSTFSLGVVANEEQADGLSERLEPLMATDGLADTSTIIEDEVLLCLPIVAFHAEGECGRGMGFTSEDEGFERAEKRRENPFEMLAALKKK